LRGVVEVTQKIRCGVMVRVVVRLVQVLTCVYFIDLVNSC
jgi:hypothetical protein